uniref:Putative secreted peptide n=1 Tax=Anopheles braziliensis TaxID=58242 RepID=A0A2M3ZVQ5_9DIPT
MRMLSVATVAASAIGITVQLHQPTPRQQIVRCRVQTVAASILAAQHHYLAPVLAVVVFGHHKGRILEPGSTAIQGMRGTT